MTLISIDSQNIASDVTKKYLPDNTTTGVGSIQIADFNKDGKNDIFLSPHNEAPFVSSPTIVFLSNGNSYQKITLNDKVMSHDTALIYLNNEPNIISATFQDDRPIKNQLIYTFDSKTNNFIINSPAGSLKFGYFSMLGEDFDNDGNIEFIFSGSTWTGSSTGFSDKMKIVTYEWINNDYASEPTQVIKPYLETAKDFRGISSLWGVNNTHVPRLWAEDFNHDGYLDVIGLNSLFGNDNFPIAIQMLQNQKKFFFEDKTNILSNNIPNYTDEWDYELSFKKLDNSGINYIFSAGGLSADYKRQSNYIIGNDGTGKLYVIFHDEFQNLNSYLYSAAIQLINGPRLYSQFIQKDSFGNFHAIINSKGEIDFLANIPSFEGIAQGDGTYKTQINYSIFNIETNINLSTYFKDNVSIQDRNQSLKIRTWAGNDTFLDVNANYSIKEKTVIDGGLGIDKSIYNGYIKDYEIIFTNDLNLLLSSKLTNTNTNSPKVNDNLINIERLQFLDKSIATDLKVDQPAGQTALLIGAVLPGKLALDLSKQALLGSVIGLFDSGYSIPVLSGALLRLDIWSILTGQSIPAASRTLAQDTAIVNYLMTNVNGIAPDAITLNTEATKMHNEASQGAWLAQLALSSAGQTHIGLLGLASTGLTYV